MAKAIIDSIINDYRVISERDPKQISASFRRHAWTFIIEGKFFQCFLNFDPILLRYAAGLGSVHSETFTLGRFDSFETVLAQRRINTRRN